MNTSAFRLVIVTLTLFLPLLRSAHAQGGSWCDSQAPELCQGLPNALPANPLRLEAQSLMASFAEELKATFPGRTCGAVPTPASKVVDRQELLRALDTTILDALDSGFSCESVRYFHERGAMEVIHDVLNEDEWPILEPDWGPGDEPEDWNPQQIRDDSTFQLDFPQTDTFRDPEGELQDLVDKLKSCLEQTTPLMDPCGQLPPLPPRPEPNPSELCAGLPETCPTDDPLPPPFGPIPFTPSPDDGFVPDGVQKGPFADPRKDICLGISCDPTMIPAFPFDDDSDGCIPSGNPTGLNSSGISRGVITVDTQSQKTTLAIPDGMTGNGLPEDVVSPGFLQPDGTIDFPDLEAFMDPCACLVASSGAFLTDASEGVLDPDWGVPPPRDLTNPLSSPAHPYPNHFPSQQTQVPLPAFAPTHDPNEVFEFDGLVPQMRCGEPFSPDALPENPEKESLPPYMVAKSGGGMFVSGATEAHLRAAHPAKASGYPVANHAGPGASTCDPVSIPSGVKFENDIDLSVTVPGRDFQLVRTFSGGYYFDRDVTRWTAGRGWDFNTSESLRYFPPVSLTEDIGGQDTRALPARIEVRTTPREYSGVYVATDDDQMHFEALGASPVSVRAGSITLSGSWGQFSDLDSSGPGAAPVRFPVWIVEAPGGGQSIFYRTAYASPDATDRRGGSRIPLSLLDGRLLQQRDEFGNVRTYEYAIHAVGDEDGNVGTAPPVVSRILLGGEGITDSNGVPAAVIRFAYDLGGVANDTVDDDELTPSSGGVGGDTVTSPGTGMVRRVEVWRFNDDPATAMPSASSWVLTQYASYLYSTDSTYAPPGGSDTMGFGSNLSELVHDPSDEEPYLLLVEQGTLINAPATAETPNGEQFETEYATSFTHFRYLDPTGRLTHRFDGDVIEFTAARMIELGASPAPMATGHFELNAAPVTGLGQPTIQRRMAYDLVHKAASTTLFNEPGAGVVTVEDIASKVVEYYQADEMGYGYPSLRGKVKSQLLRSGCGCGAGGEIKEEYSYFRAQVTEKLLIDPELSIANVVSPTHRSVSSMVCRVSVGDGAGQFTLEEMRVHHAEELREIAGFFAGPSQTYGDQGQLQSDQLLIAVPIGADYVVANETHEVDGLANPPTITRSWYSFNEFDEHLQLVRAYGPDAIAHSGQGDGFDYMPTYVPDPMNSGAPINLNSGAPINQSVFTPMSALRCLQEGVPLLLAVPGEYRSGDGAVGRTLDARSLAKSRAKTAVNFRVGGRVTWSRYDTAPGSGMDPYGRVVEQGVSRVASAAGDQFTDEQTLREMVYLHPALPTGGPATERFDLVDEIRERFGGGTNEYVATRFEYVLAATEEDRFGRVVALRTERDPESINRDALPGDTLSSWRLLNQRGDVQAIVDEHGVYTALGYDPLTGEATRVVRDAILSDLNAAYTASTIGALGAFPLPEDPGGGAGGHPDLNQTPGGYHRRATDFARDHLGNLVRLRHEYGLAAAGSYTPRYTTIRSRLAPWPKFDGSGELATELLVVQSATASTAPGASDGSDVPGAFRNVWSASSGGLLAEASFVSPASSSALSDEWIDAPGDLYASISDTASLASRITHEHSHFAFPTASREWFDIPQNLSYEHRVGYDARGRLSAVRDATGQATLYGYDVLGRVTQVYSGMPSGSGLPDPPSLVTPDIPLISELFYDWDPADGPPAQGEGNGLLTLAVSYEDEQGAARYNRILHDWRDRPRLTFASTGPADWDTPLPGTYAYAALDRLGRIESHSVFPAQPGVAAQIGTIADDAFDPELLLKVSHTTFEYGTRGTLERTHRRIQPDTAGSAATNPSNHQASDLYYDDVGRLISHVVPDAPVVLTAFDEIGRPVEVRTLTHPQANGGAVRSELLGYAAGLQADAVLELSETAYHEDLGVASLSHRHLRRHGLPASTAGLGSSAPRTTSAVVFDEAGRAAGAIDFGAPSSSAPGAFGVNDNASLSALVGFSISAEIGVSELPATVSPVGADLLVHRYAYDAVGRLFESTDAEGRTSRTLFDDMHRPIVSIENVDDGIGAIDLVRGTGKVEYDTQTERYTVGAWPTGVSVDPDANNRVTSRAYYADGSLRVLASHRAIDTGGSYAEQVQVTEYVRDPAEILGGAGSPDLAPAPFARFGHLYEIRYPDESSGEPGGSASEIVQHRYNLLGEQIAVKDQNGTVRNLLRDARGRVEHDIVTASGTGIDQTILRLSTAYDNHGRPVTMGSYGEAIVAPRYDPLNEIAYEYDHLGRLTSYRMNPTGSADELSASYVDLGVVDYAFTDTPTSARLTGMTYPAANDEDAGTTPTLLTPTYGAPGSVSQAIGRLTGVTWNDLPAPSVEHDFLGLAMPVVTVHDPGTHALVRNRFIDADNVSSTPGVYHGLDPFGRLKRHLWYFDLGVLNPGLPRGAALYPEHAALVNVSYSYTNAGNPLTRIDERPKGKVSKSSRRDTYFTHDGLSRLVAMASGPAPTGANQPYSVPSAVAHARSQRFGYDILGNAKETVTIGKDLNSSQVGFSSTYADKDLRTFNEINEVVQTTDAVFPDIPTYTEPYLYDDAGNLTRQNLAIHGVEDTNRTFIYDAWHRLTGVDYDDGSGRVPATRYLYYAGHQRALRVADDDASDFQDAPTTFERFYYDAGWRLLEVRADDGLSLSSWPVSMVNAGTPGFGQWHQSLSQLSAEWRRTTQHVWDPLALDRLVQRRVSTTPSPSTDRPVSFSERFWSLTERSSDVVAELEEVNGELNPPGIERFRYTSFGTPWGDDPVDLDWDGSVDLTDLGNFSALIGGTPWSSPEYIGDADLDANGVVNSKDWGFRKTRDKTPWGAGEYSRRGNTIGYAGSVYDPAAGLWLMRHRWLDPRVGRWLTRDPAGYVDGMSLYGYVGQRAWTAIDPWGLFRSPWHFVGGKITDFGTWVGSDTWVGLGVNTVGEFYNGVGDLAVGVVDSVVAAGEELEAVTTAKVAEHTRDKYGLHSVPGMNDEIDRLRGESGLLSLADALEEDPAGVIEDAATDTADSMGTTLKQASEGDLDAMGEVSMWLSGVTGGGAGVVSKGPLLSRVLAYMKGLKRQKGQKCDAGGGSTNGTDPKTEENDPAQQIEKNRTQGAAFEAHANLPGRGYRYPSLSGERNYRIADGIDKYRIYELKSGRRVSFDSQMRDALHYSMMTQRKYVLGTLRSSKPHLTEPVRQLIRAGKILHVEY